MAGLEDWLGWVGRGVSGMTSSRDPILFMIFAISEVRGKA